jgi:hypothetical protein
VLFGEGENNVTLSGYAPSMPYASTNGSAAAVSYDASHQFFSVNVTGPGSAGTSMLALSLSPLPDVPALPPLQATKVGDQLQVAWPASLLGCVIEKATTLVPPADWAPVTNTISLLDTRKVIYVTPNDSAAFFRLSQ